MSLKLPILSVSRVVASCFRTNKLIVRNLLTKLYPIFLRMFNDAVKPRCHNSNKTYYLCSNTMIFETGISQTELIGLIKERSSEGFNLLYKNYSDALYGVINRIVLNTASAEDLLQDTFVKIWKNIDSYNECKGTFFTWMLNIARHTSIDHLRTKQYKNQKNTGSDEILVYDTSNNKTAANIDVIGLRSTVDKMEDKYKEVINIIYFYGYTYEETAKILDLPVGTVKTRARKALSLLRNTL